MANLNEACWEGYTQKGMKDKGGKMVPNCVPIKEEVLTEANLTGWGDFVLGLMQSGTLNPVQGVALMVGVPLTIMWGFAGGFNWARSLKLKADNFVYDYKEKKKINPEQVAKLTADTEEFSKDLPKKKQQHLAKLSGAVQKAVESGDKTKILQTQRVVRKYVNRETDTQNQEIDKLHRATSKKQASAAEKRIAPVGAKHAGFGRWTDGSGKTLGYTRDGKWVPAKQKLENIDELHEGEFCKVCLAEYIKENHNILTEAEYQGRKVKLGKPMQGDVKKFKVYVKDPKTGNVKKVNFGDKTMRIKKSNPGRRKNFRARHNCDSPGPRTKARYWSCRKW